MNLPVSGNLPAGEIDLDAIALAASREAGGVPPDLLAGYLPAAADAARTGRRLAPAELAAVRPRGGAGRGERRGLAWPG